MVLILDLVIGTLANVILEEQTQEEVVFVIMTEVIVVITEVGLEIILLVEAEYVLEILV